MSYWNYTTAGALGYSRNYTLPPAPVFQPVFQSPYTPYNTPNFLLSGKTIVPNIKRPEIVHRCRCDADCPSRSLCMSGKCELNWTIRNPI